MELSPDPLSPPEPAGEATAPVPSDEVAYLLYLRTRSDEQLEGMLRAIQRRLGTRAERDDDLLAVQHIAHQLNNLRTCRDLADELGKLGSA